MEARGAFSSEERSRVAMVAATPTPFKQKMAPLATCRGARNQDGVARHWKLIASHPPSELNPHATREKYFALMFT